MVARYLNAAALVSPAIKWQQCIDLADYNSDSQTKIKSSELQIEGITVKPPTKGLLSANEGRVQAIHPSLTAAAVLV